MLVHINEFKSDLKDLFEKHRVSVREKDNYRPCDCGEVFDGTDQYLVFGKEQYYVQTVEEIVKEILFDNGAIQNC